MKMAKFATVLCVLLVACGAHGSLFDTLTSSVASAATSVDSTSLISSAASAASSAVSDLTSAASSTSDLSSLVSGITSLVSTATSTAASSSTILSLFTSTQTTWITTVANQMQTQMTAMFAALKSGIQVLNSGETVLHAAILSALGQSQTILNSFTTTDLDMSACISIATEMETIAASAIMNVTTCTSEIVDTMQSDFETTMTDMTVSMEGLYSMAQQMAACSGDFFTYLACWSGIVGSTGTQAMSDISTTMKQATVIMSDFASVKTKMDDCGIAAIQKQVTSKILTYTIKFAECAVELSAAGMSDGSSSAVLETATNVLTTLTG